MPVDPIPDKEPAHWPRDGPATGLASRHSPGPVNRTAVSDVLRLEPQLPPDHDQAQHLRPFLARVLEHPGLRHLKG